MEEPSHYAGESIKSSEQVGKPIPVVVVSDQTYKLDETAVSEILLDPRAEDRPVVVVSVAGAFRKGKSFLLNFILRYLYAKNDPDWLGDVDFPLKGFSWRGGSERVTNGILMWSEPFIIKRGGEEVAVLLMDTQGAFDRQATVKDCATVFALSTMLSSVQVYNLSGNIQENDLQHLQLFTEYGRLALESNNNLKPFQTLQFLVRDWYYPYECAYGEEGGKKFLEKILQVSGNQQTELQQLRNHLRSCFQNIDCYLMPHPGEEVAENPDFDGRLKDTRPNFQKTLKSYIERLLDAKNLVVKKINGSNVTGKELLEYFKSYMNIFNEDKLPEPKSVFQATAEGNNLIAVAKARDLYSKEMENFFARDKHCLKQDILESEHMRSLEMVLASFNQTRKIGDTAFHKPYAENLKLELKELNKKYIRELSVLIESAETGNLAAVEKAMDLYSKEMKNFFTQDKHCLKQNLLDMAHKQYVDMALASFNQTPKIGDVEFRKPYTEKLKLELARICRKYKRELSVLIESAEACNLIVVAKARELYSNEMESFFAHDKHCLKPDLLEIEHKRSVRMALDSFNQARKLGGIEFSQQYAQNLELELEDRHKIYERKLFSLIESAECGNLAAVAKARDLYSKEMESICAFDKPYLAPKGLEKVHNRCAKMALDSFNETPKLGGAEFREKYENNLKLQLQEKYEGYMKQNSINIKKQGHKSLKNAGAAAVGGAAATVVTAAAAAVAVEAPIAAVAAVIAVAPVVAPVAGVIVGVVGVVCTVGAFGGFVWNSAKFATSIFHRLRLKRSKTFGVKKRK